MGRNSKVQGGRRLKPFIENFPFFSIMLPMLAGTVSFALRRWDRQITISASLAVCVLSAVTLGYTLTTGESFTYTMGHTPAPWGNELRAGALEALFALVFSVVMLLSITGGLRDINRDIPDNKQVLFFVMLNLLLASMMAITYTNDLFTAYVFIDITAIGACSVITARPGGKPMIATMLYLIMSLVGSSLVLLAISLLYGITGHLLMEPLRAAVEALVAAGDYILPLFVMFALLTVGLGIKSAMFPFHVWLPGAHANATTAASSILSGLIIKVYLFFAVKVICRILGREIAGMIRVSDLLLVLGIMGLVMGSVHAIRQRDLKRMLSYSTVAQVGYICIGIGLNTAAGMVAACFHLLAHAVAKPMLFTAAGGLIGVSGHKKDYVALVGAARRDPLSGAAFLAGALSLIGIPMFSGFVSKFYLATASLETPFTGVVIIAVMVVSTLLNAMYYLPAAVCILARPPAGEDSSLPRGRSPILYRLTLLAFLLLNLGLGLFSAPVLAAIERGLAVFG